MQHGSPSESLVQTERFPVANLYCVCCAESLQAALPAHPHIERAHVDFMNDVIEVAYHPSMISREQVEALIRESGRELARQ